MLKYEVESDLGEKRSLSKSEVDDLLNSLEEKDNDSKVVKKYKELVRQLKSENEKLSTKVKKSRSEIDKLSTDNTENKDRVNVLEKENKKLLHGISEIEAKLQKDFYDKEIKLKEEAKKREEEYKDIIEDLTIKVKTLTQENSKLKKVCFTVSGEMDEHIQNILEDLQEISKLKGFVVSETKVEQVEVEKDFDNFDKKFKKALNSLDDNETISIKHLREIMNSLDIQLK